MDLLTAKDLRDSETREWFVPNRRYNCGGDHRMNICKKQILNILDLKLALYKEVKPVKAEITKKWQEMIQENRRNSTSPEVDNSLPKKKRRVQKPKSPLRSTRKQKLESGSSKPNSDLGELVIAFEEETTQSTEPNTWPVPLRTRNKRP